MPKIRLKDKHLKQRGRIWWLVVRVPLDIQKVTPDAKPVIEESLRTDDVLLARRLRDARVKAINTEWNEIRIAIGSVPNLIPKDLLLNALSLKSDQSLTEREREEYAQDLVIDLEARLKHNEINNSADPLNEAAGAIYRIAKGKHGNIEEAGEHYLSVADLKEGSKKLYRGVYKAASPIIGNIDRVTKERARKYIIELAATNRKSTVRNHRTALSSLWQFLDKDESIWSLPKKVKLGLDNDERGRFTDEEAKRLIEFASDKYPRHAFVIKIAFHIGARQDELVRIQYDEKLDQLVIPSGKTEAARRRIPCPNAIREYVIEWIKAPLASGTISTRFKEITERAGIPQRVTIDGMEFVRVFHSTRNTVAAKLTELGCPIELLKKILGHKDRDITVGLYGRHFDVETLRPWVDKIKYE